MFILLLIAALNFSVRDLLDHKIYNRDLVIFFLSATFISLYQVREVFFLSALIYGFSALLLALFGLGGGDVKLVALLALFYLAFDMKTLISFLLAFSLLASGAILIHFLRGKSIQDSLALAPIICGAVIWCAR